MSAVAHRIVGVDHAVAGFAEVSQEVLARKLGHAAWHVWQVLCARRDRRGETHVTLPGIANAYGFVPMGVANVRRALARLKRAGLVEDIGWRMAEVPYGRTTRTLRVFMRRVRGARQLSVVGRERVSVPFETATWLKTAATWGGMRVGAGRKKQGAGESSVAVAPPLTGESSVAPELNTSTSAPEHKAGRGSVLSEQKAGRAGEVIETSLGAVLLPEKRRRRPPAQPLLAYPGVSVVAPAYTPPPPKLRDTDDEAVQVAQLAAAFRACIEREYGGRCYLLSKLSRRAPSYAKLARAAELLRAFDVAPMAWCAFAVRRWRLARTHAPGYVDGTPVPLPPISVVFSVRQIEERLEDEDRRDVVETCCVGGRAIFGKTHKALLQRYAQMQGALLSGATAEAAKERFFPGSLYDDMVDAAKVEAVETRMRLDDDARRGRWVW